MGTDFSQTVKEFFYCSQLSRGASERAFGTASVGELWLLIEYARPWGAHALQDSELSAEVKNYLEQLVRRIPRARLLFIKQETKRGQREHGFNFFVIRAAARNPLAVKFKLDDYEQLTNIYLDVSQLAAGEGGACGGEPLTEPLYLVCTHGKRDKCCAKFGYPLYKSLREEKGNNVWQSSHVGGDRFAANLICFPHGLFYAHMTRDEASTVTRAYEQEHIVLDKFRGRACYSYPVQAAEFFIRTEAGLTGLSDLRHLSSERAGQRSWRIRFVSRDERQVYQALVVSRASAFHNYITCGATEEKHVVQFYLEDYAVLST